MKQLSICLSDESKQMWKHTDYRHAEQERVTKNNPKCKRNIYLHISSSDNAGSSNLVTMQVTKSGCRANSPTARWFF